MNEMRLENPDMLHLFWLLPLLAGVLLYRFRMKDRALKAFADAALLARVNATVSRAGQWRKAAILLSALLCIVFSLARPAWNPRPEKIERKGRDIVLVLDVSRSMLAEDLKPNRLERAKLSIRDLADGLDGDRVALVVFAGNAVLRCPLTQDYGFLRMALDDIGVDSVSRGGTLIGDALRMVKDDVFSDHLKRYKDVILITDGEDQDSFPVDAARELGERGIRLIAIGLGDENEGQRIPTKNEKGERTFVQYRGREVWSRLDADTLRKMVDATPGGKYLNVAVGDFDLGGVYRSLIAGAEKRDVESRAMRRYEEKFQLFLGAGIVLLLVESLVRERKRASALAVLLCLSSGLLAAPAVLHAESAAGLVARGNERYEAGEYDEALKAYEEAKTALPESPEIEFNMGNALYGKGEYDKAGEAFEQAALRAEDPALEARARYNMGNTAFAAGEKLLESDLEKALAEYGTGVRHFQDALRLDPGLQDAAANIEVVRIRMKDLMDRIKQEQENAEKDGSKSPDSQSPDSRSSDSQSPDSQSPDSGRREVRREDAGQADRRNDRQGEQERQGARSAGNESPERQGEQSKQASESASGQSGEDRKEAGAHGRNAQPGEKTEERNSAVAAGPDPAGAASAGRDLAEDILREEKENRLMLQRSAVGGYRAVDKDW